MPMRPLRIAALLFGAPGAGSFVTAGEQGLARAAEEWGLSIDAHHCPDTAEEVRLRSLAAIAATAPDLIVVHGGQGEALVATLAREMRRVCVAVSQGAIVGDNVASYEVRLEESAFLAGAFAGHFSRSGIAGHLSGERVRPGLKGRAAFAAGLGHARPDARLLTSFCGEQHDARLAERYANAQIANGADVVFTMLGAGRQGVVTACRAHGARQIGDGIDWCAIAPDVFIASAVADVSWGPYQAVCDFAAGRFRAGERTTVGLERPDLCDLAMSAEAPRPLRSLVADIRSAIRSGALRIPDDWAGTEFWPEQTTYTKGTAAR
jgi:basic membrane protein A